MAIHHTSPPAITINGSAVDESSWFGESHMLENGTIIIRQEWKLIDGNLVEAQNTFRPGDPFYLEVLRHLGGLKPGQHKVAPPWEKPLRQNGSVAPR